MSIIRMLPASLLCSCLEYGVHGAGWEDTAAQADGGPVGAGESSGEDDVSDPGGGGGGGSESCPVPVPDHVDLTDVVWAEPGVHFYVPDPTWALASAHAHRQTLGLAADGIALELRPSYFFATALKESFMGCSDATGPDPLHGDMLSRQAAADWDGCFQIESTTAWTELCRLYGDEIDCEQVTHTDAISSMNQELTGHDNVESSIFAATWFNTFAYAMLTTHGTSDPDGWFAAASDDQAMLKTIALIYNRGAWSGEVSSVIAGCQDAPIEDCITPDSVAWDYVTAVSSYARDMEDALAEEACYRADVTAEDVRRYCAAVAVIFPGQDWVGIEAAAVAALGEVSGGAEAVPFQEAAGVVLDAIDAAWSIELRCPDASLGWWYGVSCPG